MNVFVTVLNMVCIHIPYTKHSKYRLYRYICTARSISYMYEEIRSDLIDLVYLLFAICLRSELYLFCTHFE